MCSDSRNLSPILTLEMLLIQDGCALKLSTRFFNPRVSNIFLKVFEPYMNRLHINRIYIDERHPKLVSISQACFYLQVHK